MTTQPQGEPLLLSDSGITTHIIQPDLFDLSLRDDVPNLILGGLRRLVLSNLAAQGMLVQAERDVLAQEPEAESGIVLMRFLIEEGTNNPKLVSDFADARARKAAGENVDWQGRHSQRDLVIAYDSVLGRGGLLYAAWFHTDEQPTAVSVEPTQVAENGDAAESGIEVQAERELAGLDAG